MRYVERNKEQIIEWGRRRPQLLKYFKKLNDHNIPWGIYCGSAAKLLTGNRQTNDLDIVVPTKNFQDIVRLSPAKSRIRCNPDCKVVCGDGAVLDFPQSSVEFNLDNEEVEVMASTSAKLDNHKYKLGMSQTAIDNRLKFDFDDVTVYFSNPFDTMALKSVLQRSPAQDKHDLADIKSLKSLYPPCQEYMTKRADEINLDERSLSFLRTCDIGLPAAV